MENSPIEFGPRPMLTKEEVFSEMKKYDENAQFSREKSDVNGQLYFVEFTAEGKVPGETIEYIYLRKGAYPDGNQSGETAIVAYYYDEGMPVDTEKIAVYSEDTGEWKEEQKIRNEPENSIQPKAEEFGPKSLEDSLAGFTKEQKIENLSKAFDEGEAAFLKEGREGAKPFLNTIYTYLINLNKTELQPLDKLKERTEESELTQEQFDELNLRRKKLSNAVGTLNSGRNDHDLNPI